MFEIDNGDHSIIFGYFDVYEQFQLSERKLSMEKFVHVYFWA